MSSFLFDNAAPYVTATTAFGIGLAFVVFVQRNSSSSVSKSPTLFGWLQQAFNRLLIRTSCDYTQKPLRNTKVVRFQDQSHHTTVGRSLEEQRSSDAEVMPNLDATYAMSLKNNADIQGFGLRMSNAEENIALLQNTTIRLEENNADNRRMIAIANLNQQVIERKTNEIVADVEGMKDSIEGLKEDNAGLGKSIIILSLTVLAVLGVVAAGQHVYY